MGPGLSGKNYYDKPDYFCPAFFGRTKSEQLIVSVQGKNIIF
jgi:hypothetical protein